ncbi:DNA primase [Phaeobacter gallaeciensis]|uniref:DNA primase n=2 Tax=Roseobacteraceae TaxID=2854170 RepID=A0A366WI62_9RHOB|nr:MULTISPECIES: DNA primase [Roseobacteraceae]MBT3139849.1 DNA primase [Falsiruegeria litorea]MBT8167088.1 DNA primase [Falsiruegeria litorea]RBW49655.1 DNA primase [Phaeobacter gallaeciensis]
MSLPPGFLDELRSRSSLSQVVGRKVMWDPRKSNQGKGDMWAPCPFHHEKSASFHVDDRKGFYYCFGCHAKGDAIKFVQETENVGFMEAVEILAREAGMPMPARDPKAQEKQDRRTLLAEVMEQAVQYFRLQLKTGAAADARAYVAKRGLNGPALERWEIGFAPNGWQNLWDHLRGKGVAEDLIIGAGLAKPSTKGGKPYDTFRNRIMFPIRDARGRAVAFGGRAMDPNDNAKYLNSPETELFDKGRSLYNQGPARTAAGQGQTLLVAEGYMDVIALAEGGFGASVAPLGTAITESQLQMLWRIADEPIIALDGDTAGLRAAMRLIELALPLLEAGKSLRFALMPEGKDPDDLIRGSGPEAVQSVLDQAMPMVKLLWQRETEGKVFDSPERKAGLDKTLREKIKLIRDPSIRAHYGQEIKDLRWELFRPQRKPRAAFQAGGGQWQGGGGKGKGRWKAAPEPAMPGTRASLLASATEEAQIQMREAVILATTVKTPKIVVQFEQQLEAMECRDQDHAMLRDMVLRYAIDSPGDLSDRIYEALGPEPLENLFALRHVAISPCVRRPGDLELAEMILAEELAKLTALRGLTAEIAEAKEEIAELDDEAVTWRVAQAAEERNRATRSENEDKAIFDVADNGARINRDERDSFAAILDSINFERKR